MAFPALLRGHGADQPGRTAGARRAAAAPAIDRRRGRSDALAAGPGSSTVATAPRSPRDTSPGPLNVPLEPSFASYVGWLVPFARRWCCRRRRRRGSPRRRCNCFASGETRSSGHLGGGVDAWAASGARAARPGRGSTELVDELGAGGRARSSTFGRARSGTRATSRVPALLRRRPARPARRSSTVGAADGHLRERLPLVDGREPARRAPASPCGWWRGRASRARFAAGLSRPAGSRLERRLVPAAHVADEPAHLEPHQQRERFGDRDPERGREALGKGGFGERLDRRVLRQREVRGGAPAATTSTPRSSSRS